MLKLYGSRRRVITPQFANIAVTSVITLDSIITMFAEKFAVRGFAVAVMIAAVLFAVSSLLFGPRFSFGFLKSNNDRNIAVSLAVGTFATNIITIVVCNLTSYRIETTQFVTVCCIANALLYLLYYIIMKYRKREKWCKFSKRSVVAATLLWFVALLCFFKEETDWTLTIAQSRAVNRPCILLNFFDYHDLWHMASALASLLLLVGVSSLDDDLCAIPTRELSVF
ncbi:hypothetical protein OESDEN_25594 [Oesophagostomum dentatum]|uniref:Uncharacterized protein n=1 Tax=Oesophagostomum dentatum TaxID=61180 RepID=A0A0B1RUR7_OESDE|nr:hypothetical protein OESDEN_25594 [Oesophagostomum dentatum]